MDFIKANLWEIKQSSSLKVLGFILALIHIFTFFNWSDLGVLSNPHYAPLCWGFFPQCDQSYLFSHFSPIPFGYTYLILSALALVSFLSFTLIGLGYFLLFTLFIFKSYFYFYDFSLNHNIHSFHLLLGVTFLLIPQKKRLSKALIIATFLIFSALKFNQDWLAGYWLKGNIQIHLPLKGIEWLAALSLFIEAIVPWLLFSKISARFFTGIIILFIYNLFYISIDPLIAGVSLLLLVFLTILFHEQNRIERESLYRSYLRPEPNKLWIYLTLSLFLSFQLLPQVLHKEQWTSKFPLIYKKYPVPVECEQHSFIQWSRHTLHIVHKMDDDNTNALLKCKSQPHLMVAKKMCELYSKESHFIGITTSFVNHKISQQQFNPHIQFQNICAIPSKDF